MNQQYHDDEAAQVLVGFLLKRELTVSPFAFVFEFGVVALMDTGQAITQ